MARSMRADIREIGQVFELVEGGDELGQTRPVMHHERRFRGRLAQEGPCDMVKILARDQAHQRREAFGQRFAKGHGDVVAVDAIAPPGGTVAAVGEPLRLWRGRVEQPAAKLCLTCHASTRVRAPAARRASSARTGQSGTSVSHSTSKGLGPERASV